MAERFPLPADWLSVLASQGQTANLAWEPRVLGSLVTQPDAAQELFRVALQVRLAESQGHTRLALNGPGCPGWLGQLGPVPDAPSLRKHPALAAYVGGAEETTPLVAGDGWIATGRSVDLERRLAKAIQARNGDGAPVSIPPEILHQPRPLNEDQLNAIHLVARSRLALITGGPGTGKTSILAALLKTFQGVPTALAAPTGKAAQRMSQALEGLEAPEPLTLHRLLGWRPRQGDWRHHRGQPLGAALVIVDEASMVDLELMTRLVEALAPESRLVLMGDADQLPSVGKGAVLRDLVEALPQVVVRLERSYRMSAADPDGGSILAFANRVKEGVATESDLPVRPTAPDLAWHGLELLRPEGLPAFIQAWWDRIRALEGFDHLIHLEHRDEGQGIADSSQQQLGTLLDHYDRFRLLALLQEGPGLTGAADLNGKVHALAWPVNGKGNPRDLPFFAGEPVMMVRNDYARGLFNGDQGLVVKVNRGGTLHWEVVFRKGDRLTSFPLAPLAPSLELAYALTVHKAQGSEFDAVAVVLPQGDHPLLSRQNLYTALTRARRHALIVGDPTLVELAARREDRRITGLTEYLRA